MNKMSQTGKLMPNLDQSSTKTKMINLTVLQRIDPHIEEILITAVHVAFYKFDIDSHQWSRKDVEGSLFVVKRNTQPRFQFIVMNRRSEDNLVENLLGDFEYEIQVPYLLYRNAAQEVNGIWFYNSHECEEVANLFTRILGAYSKVQPKMKSSSKSGFEELEAVPTTAVIEGPLEPSFNGSGSAVMPVDSPFMNLFRNSMNIGHNINVAPSPPLTPQVPSYPLPAPSTFPIQHYNTPDAANGHNWVTNQLCPTNLVLPSTFMSHPPSSSPLQTPPTSSLLPASSFQPHPRPHGTPLLQPFPPPTPSPSLTPAAPSYGPISKDRVQEAFMMLVQDNQFIDMFYQALQKTHQ